MQKGNILIVSICFIIGVLLGIGGMYYHYNIYPQKQAYTESQKQQEQLNDMFYTGKVLLVDKDNFTIEVRKRAGKPVKSQNIKIKVNDQTRIQVGMKFIHPDSMDLTKILKLNKTVDVINNHGTALVLHFD